MHQGYSFYTFFRLLFYFYGAVDVFIFTVFDFFFTYISLEFAEIVSILIRSSHYFGIGRNVYYKMVHESKTYFIVTRTYYLNTS